jgi:hypothetical protein
MKQIFEVKLTYVVLVLAEDGEEAEEVARKEVGEITSDMDAEFECGASFRSRDELDAWGEITRGSWGDECHPYSDVDNKLTLGQLLDEIEAADQAEAEVAALRCTKTDDMFSATPAVQVGPVQPPDFRLMVARRHAGEGDDWFWAGMEFIGDNLTGGVLIWGGIPNIDHMGEKRWTGVRTEKVFVSEEQVHEEALMWESQTGKCSACGGSGQAHIRWHHETGNQYSECGRCVGTGKAKEVAS